MPTSSEAGISLVEMLAALFIIGLTATFVSLSMPRGSEPLQKASSKFVEQVKLARNLAQTTGEAYGIRVNASGSRLLVYRRGEWVQSRAVEEFSDIELADRMRFELENDRKRNEKSRIEAEAQQGRPPQIWFDPTGIVTSEPVYLHRDADQMSITVSRNGEINVSSTR